MSAKLLQKIVDNFQTAIILHAEIASTMRFIALNGLAMLHEYQYVSEAHEMRLVKKYAIESYGIYIKDSIPESANLAMPLLDGKNRTELSQKETIDILQKAWAAYIDWEAKTLKLYSTVAIDLFNDGDIAAFNLVSEIVSDVRKELTMATGVMIEFTSHGFDMSQVIADDRDIEEKYREKLNELELGRALIG